ncbi:hypothetical protein [Mesonia sp. K4-1]|jgi:hypothetical protein|uniref:hypothetical protein n=1 Tax=Mesonia sp. K4-1 TaxID=2602760 RepID=UPI0011C92D70|nr:hypothetical protein [Mesonia sp. K4-1]TXK71965.1 hypothetical protein FT986_15025 [Mesonia sp. K4-1]
MYQGYISLEKCRRIYKEIIQNPRDRILSNSEWCEFVASVNVPPGYNNTFVEDNTWVDRLNIKSRLEK